MKAKNIGFVSTRFAGTDGVSLEASKWAGVFEEKGHRCYWFAGKLDRNPDVSHWVPEAHFKHLQNQWIGDRIMGRKGRKPAVTELIHVLRSLLKIQLYNFVEQFKIDLLVVENALTIPVHIPLGLAITEIIAETQIPTIAHHHDFYWERERFSVNAVSDYLQMAFPPKLPNIRHVVINSEAGEQLALRTGISSSVIPNVIDFDNRPIFDEKASRAFRESIGLTPDDKMILQPTRIVRRKGIERAIELVRELKDPKYKLVISHEAGDEGYDYAEWLMEYAREQRVDLRLVTTEIADPLNGNGNGQAKYSLWDIYPHADFITYPSLYEGFGNAFLEAVYFKKPILINRYATFIRDIEPKGFELVVMDGYLTRQTVQRVREILESDVLREKMGDANYRIAARHFSYAKLRKQLDALMNEFFDEREQPLSPRSEQRENVVYLQLETEHGEDRKAYCN